MCFRAQRFFRFGLVLSPRIFTKCIDAAMVPLRLQGIRIMNYILCQKLHFYVKMVPSMAAVLRAPGKLCSFSYVILVFLLFYVLDVVSITVYDRDTLLNIGSSVAQRKPDFEFLNAGGLFTDTASEPFVWAAQPRKRCRCRKRGKRAGVLVRLRCRAFQPPLPTILLANVQSLDNKFCELRVRISYQRETRDCCVICLTETWMSAMVPDSAIELTGFSLQVFTSWCSDHQLDPVNYPVGTVLDWNSSHQGADMGSGHWSARSFPGSLRAFRGGAGQIFDL